MKKKHYSRYNSLINRHLGIILLVAFFQVGCQSTALNTNLIEVAHQPNESQLYNGESPEWGLALSGGGLRAASFSFGVLKSLYDAGILEDIDVLSTVSGGGYTGYEVMVNDYASGYQTDQFGGSTYAEEFFFHRLFGNYATANFATYRQMFRAAVTSDTFPNMYRKQIERRYGYAMEQNARSTFTLSDLSDAVKTKKTPNFVVNTTLLDPAPLHVANSVYEFTPFSAGNIMRGYYVYQGEDEQALSNLIAISGAAVASFLKQTIKDPTRFSNEELTLSDGGHSENLGAFSLISRHTKNVIIVDAEHDTDYEFEAYTILKEKLNSVGMKMTIKDIEVLIADSEDAQAKREALSQGGRMKTPVLIGQVVKKDNPSEVVSTLYYLKMANTDKVDVALSTYDLEEGAQQIKSVRRDLEDSKDDQGFWYPSTLNAGKYDFKTILAHQLATYPGILESLYKVKLLNVFGANLNFPHYSTGDQSFYNNQYLAFVGLGYFSGNELSLVIPPN